MDNEIDYSTLSWVRTEIDETLKQARHSLEEFVENPSDSTLLRFCLTYIHQVYGTLQMVELYGGALLAEEMEHLAEALLENSITRKNDAYEVLMRAILQLPDYLERVQSGAKDDPLVLMPLLNDLRAARGEKLLSENSLFAPDLAKAKTVVVNRPETALSEADIRMQAKRLRPHYQVGLLGWYRDQDTQTSLKTIGKILRRLEQACVEEHVVRLWWVAGGVIEALLDRSLKVSVALKLLLGHVDREIKRLIDVGEEEVAKTPATELLKNLLYYVARSNSSRKKIVAIKDAFNLAGALPSEEEVEHARASLGGPNASMMATVSEAIREDLAQVKDALDLYLRSHDRNLDDLKSQTDTLRKIADTLGMLGLGVPRKVILDQDATVKQMLDGELEPTEGRLMEVAGSLLFVESSLEGLVQNRIRSEEMREQPAQNDEQAGEGEQTGIQTLSDIEYRHVLELALKEMCVDIARAKDSIVSFIDAPWDHNVLGDVPPLFERTSGAMDIVSMDRAAHFVRQINDYVNQRLLQDRMQPEQKELDYFADAIASIEYYLEATLEERQNRDSILDLTAESLSHIGYGEEPPTPDKAGLPEKDVSAAQESSAESVETLAGETDQTTLEDTTDISLSVEMPAEQELSQTIAPTDKIPTYELPGEEQGVLTPEAVESLDQSQTIAPTDEIPAFELPGEDQGELAQEAEDSQEQTEITATSELERTAELEDILTGELESSLELEHAFEPDLSASPETERKVETEEPAPGVELEPSTDLEQVVTEPESVTAEMVEAPIEQKAIPNRMVLEDIDDDILEIFIEEAKEELQVIEELLPKWADNFKEEESLTRIRRAFHTLKGSGRLVGALTIGELAWSIENMLNRVLDHTLHVTDEMVVLINDAMSVLPKLVQGLEDGVDPGLDIQSLIDRGFAIVEHEKQVSKEEPEDQLIDEVTSAIEAEIQLPELEPEPVLEMDEALEEIFVKESTQHLTEIDKFIDRCQKNDRQCMVNDEFLRALHTLHGSARMAGAEPIANIAGLLEKYAKVLMSNEQVFSGEGLMLLVDGIDAIKTMLNQINKAGEAIPDTADLLDKLGILYSHEAEQQEQKIRDQHAVADWEPTEAVPETDVDLELLQVFLEEGAEILENTETSFQELKQDKQNRKQIENLQRLLHTLKGGARMAGISTIGDLSHGVEHMLTAVVEDQYQLVDESLDVLQQCLDRLFKMLEATRNQQTEDPANDLLKKIAQLLGEEAAEPEPAEAPVSDRHTAEVIELAVETTSHRELPEMAVTTEYIPTPSLEEKRVTQAVPQEQVRVSSELLDNLVNNAGEVSIFRSRLEQQNNSFSFNLVELDQTVSRLRDQLRQFEIETEAQILFRHEKVVGEDQEFDPLEMDRYSNMQQLSRALVESASDIGSIQNLMENLVKESEGLLVQQSRVNTSLQESLMRTRMVSWDRLVPRMQRLVRQTAQELGKEAKLSVYGEQSEIDRTVLERITAPLEHMIRNAVSHGIESSEERTASGKSPVGQIKMSLNREGGELVIVVADDGKGIDLDAIRRKATERGLMDADAELTDNDVMQMILESGFSTAKEVTQIAGRGVGMDVVNSELKQLGGALQIDSIPNQGTTFTIRLPFTLAINHALLVQLSDELYAVPLTSIEGIVRMSCDELQGYLDNQNRRFQYAGYAYQVKRLATSLYAESTPLPSGDRLLPLLLVRAGDHHMAFQVDNLLGSREIVVKSVGPQISTVRGISGATILGDGRVVLILDMGSIIRLGARAKPGIERVTPEALAAAKGELNVMVVDDSITVRKVTTRLLERNSMKVVTAKDGVDAVGLLQEQIPDIMLLDIEMPRMDGFELATYMRNEEQLKNVPIIMITSRSGEKHRRRAEQIGVNEYLGKPYHETDLLAAIERLTDQSHADA